MSPYSNLQNSPFVHRIPRRTFLWRRTPFQLRHAQSQAVQSPIDLLPSKPINHAILLQHLFPKTREQFEYKRVEPQQEIMASTKVVTRQKLTENLAQIFANIETGNLTHAERIFQRAWRSNRPEMQLMVDARLIHKFINVSSER
jgi:hypothetical protein